ncbi:hypothetical protein ABH920_000838 [Catenulispora sp. EB89]|uniref:HD-GYP domain-containing protein n=1 Tax=Catenulispora sp. EB89 TaxID=3156257 RepID=UPI003512604D
MPFSVRCYIFGLVAVAFAAIATLPLSRTHLPLLLALCALVVAAERLSRVQIGTSGWTMSVSLVVTLITVLVLAPPAAAIVGLISSVPWPRLPSWTWTKQIVNSAMSSLVPASGAAVCHLAGGHVPGHFLSFPEFLWPSAAAVTASLVVNGLIIAGYSGLATHIRFVDALRGDLKRATMPYYSSGVLALIFLSLWDDIGWYTAPLVVVPMYIAHWSLSQYAKEGAAHEGTIAALVQAVEIKDSYTRGHSERVARGAEMLAEQLKMPQDRLVMLRFAGLLHDIGKLGVPTRLLTSTGGLTEEEFKLMCMHPNHGVAVLRDIRFLTEVYEGVLYHHERLDGRGYPTGKSGDEIPEFARIIGVADAFDAMTSTRSYRAARSVEQAVAELRRGAGTQFDPALVQAFEAALQLAERSGQPWLPTELVPAEPPQDEATAAAATGPWPLPKRVPGFSFADHDDPFVPVEWFSDWYPSWLEHGGEPGPEDGTRPVPELLGGIPGQRVTEPEPELAAGVSGAAGADFDDGWSERMHSAVVREAGPEPDEGWAWDGEAAENAENAENAEAPLAEPVMQPSDAVADPEAPAAELAGAGPLPAAPGMQQSNAVADSEAPPAERVIQRSSAVADSGASPAERELAGAGPLPAASGMRLSDAVADPEVPPAELAGAEALPAAPGMRPSDPVADPEAPPAERVIQQSSAIAGAEPESADTGVPLDAEPEPDPDHEISVVPDRSAFLQHLADLAAAFGSEPEPEPEPEAPKSTDPQRAANPSPRWPVDPGLRGDPRGSMRVRAATPAADPDPRGPEPAADFDLRKPVVPCHDVTGSVTELVVEPAADGDGVAPVHPPKTGDPEAWTPSPEPWTAPEPPAEASKAAAEAADLADLSDLAEADSRNGSSAGPAWFLHGAGGSSSTLHFFGPGDAAWPPRDPDAKDSEESSA